MGKLGSFGGLGPAHSSQTGSTPVHLDKLFCPWPLLRGMGDAVHHLDMWGFKLAYVQVCDSFLGPRPALLQASYLTTLLLRALFHLLPLSCACSTCT